MKNFVLHFGLALAVAISIPACGGGGEETYEETETPETDPGMDPGTETPIAGDLALFLFSGVDGDPINKQIPDMKFPDADSGAMDNSTGVAMSTKEIVVVFADDTTLAEANDILKSLNASVAGGIPRRKQALLHLQGALSLKRAIDAQTALLGNPMVKRASLR